MTDIVLDQGAFFPSPLTGWYRERPFKVALVGSLLVHAALIAAVPGFRAVVIEVPQVLNVEILKEKLPQPVVPAPVRRQPEPRPEVVQPPPMVEPPPMVKPLAPPPPVVEKPVIRPEPKVRQPESVVSPPDPVVPEPVMRPPVVRQPAPDVPLAPKTEVIQIPRPEQRPDPVVVPKVVVPKPDLQPTPNLEPRAQVQPESPVPRVAPPPQPAPTIQPQIAAVTPPQRDAPQPAIPQASVQAPAVVAPAPPVQAARTEPAAERTLTSSYEKSLADLIKRQETYPDRARRQGWQGTAVVGLSLSAEGKVMDISIIESSGRDILDEAALNMVRRASPLPRAPEGLRGTERTVRVPIVFKLQNS